MQDLESGYSSETPRAAKSAHEQHDYSYAQPPTPQWQMHLQHSSCQSPRSESEDTDVESGRSNYGLSARSDLSRSDSVTSTGSFSSGSTHSYSSEEEREKHPQDQWQQHPSHHQRNNNQKRWTELSVEVPQAWGSGVSNYGYDSDYASDSSYASHRQTTCTQQAPPRHFHKDNYRGRHNNSHHPDQYLDHHYSPSPSHSHSQHQYVGCSPHSAPSPGPSPRSHPYSYASAHPAHSGHAQQSSNSAVPPQHFSSPRHACDSPSPKHQLHQQPHSQNWNGSTGFADHSRPATSSHFHPQQGGQAQAQAHIHAAPLAADRAEIAADMMSLARHNRVDELVSMLDRNRNGPGAICIDERDKFGNTVLTTACQNGLKRMAKLALRHGADINLKNFTSGNTPLHFCFKYGYGETLGAYLISKGADDSIHNHAGQTCHQDAPNPEPAHAVYSY